MKNKIISLFVILLIIAIIMPMNIIHAGDINVDGWIPTIGGENTKLIEIVGKVLGVIQVVGSIVSVIALSVIGIKYMVGSVEEKAKYKETMTAYIIGCVLLFAISNLTSIIYQISTNMFKYEPEIQGGSSGGGIVEQNPISPVGPGHEEHTQLK